MKIEGSRGSDFYDLLRADFQEREEETYAADEKIASHLIISHRFSLVMDLV